MWPQGPSQPFSFKDRENREQIMAVRRWRDDRQQAREPEEASRCALCGRPLGAKTELHHVIPKSRGGREVVPVHPICHRTIHATLSEAELERLYPSMADLRDHPQIAKFLSWVADKPADFHKRTEPRGGRKRR